MLCLINMILLIATVLIAVIVEVRIVRITILVVIPTIAVAVWPVSSSGSDGCRADCMHIVAVGCLIGDFYLIGA